jgi:hypothetical protein
VLHHPDHQSADDVDQQDQDAGDASPRTNFEAPSIEP